MPEVNLGPCPCCTCEGCCGHTLCPVLYFTYGCDEPTGLPGSPNTPAGTVESMPRSSLGSSCPCTGYATQNPAAPGGPTFVFCGIRIDLKCGVPGDGISQRNSVRVYSDGGGLCQLNGGQFDFIDASASGETTAGYFRVNSCNPVDVDIFTTCGTPHKITE